MSTSSTICLGAVREQAKQRADLESNQSVSDPEWNGYINLSYKELYDLLVGAYSDYFLASPFAISTTNAQFYDLPSDYYKLMGVDLQYSSSPTGWISLKNFEFLERNRFGYPNTAVNVTGLSNLRYRVMGSQIELIPIPMSSQNLQLWYIPVPTNLQYMFSCTTVLNTGTVGVVSTSGLSTGMNVSGSGVPDGVTIQTMSSTSFTINGSVTATQASAILSLWKDSTLLDGISGWEEFIIIDSAIKAQIKQEEDIGPLAAQKAAMVMRIEAMSQGRDVGQASHTTDAMALNNYNGAGWGFGSGSGEWGGF